MKKKLNKSKKKILYVALLGVILAAASIALFLYEKRNKNHVFPRNTYLSEKDISFYTEAQFKDFVVNFEKEKELSIFDVEIRGEKKAYTYGDFYGKLDVQGFIMDYKSSSAGIFEEYYLWLKSFWLKKNLDKKKLFNNDSIESSIETVVSFAELKSEFNGSASIQGVKIITEDPYGEEYIEKEILLNDLKEFYFTERKLFTLDILEKNPSRSISVLKDLKKEVDFYLEGPITFSYSQSGESLFGIELSVEEIADLIFVTLPEDPEKKPLLKINDIAFLEHLKTLYAKSAEFVVEEGVISISPSRKGLDVDILETKKRFLAFRERNAESRNISISAYRVLAPEVKTQDLEKLNIKEKVSSFTTYHSCCKARTDNIQLLADILDGVVLAPGDFLDVNKLVGERNEEKGFKPAPTIIKGHLTNTVGGGISQFITTLHNAVYWGGYELSAFKPHSIYFSRYPKGIEATINYPHVEYIFKNDSEYPVLIDTEYTDTSITVNLFSLNYGRTISGDHRYGRTNVSVEGGSPESRKVISNVSDPYNYKEPRIVFKKDPSVIAGETRFIQEGKKGWTVDVERSVYQAGNLLHKDKNIVNYLGSKDTIIHVNNCNTDKDSNICI